MGKQYRLIRFDYKPERSEISRSRRGIDSIVGVGRERENRGHRQEETREYYFYRFLMGHTGEKAHQFY